MDNRIKRACLLLLLAAGVAGCAFSRSPKTPLDRLSYGTDGERGSTLIVFLPGRGGAAKDFESQGFVEASLARDPSIEMVAVDAHFGYYRTGTFVERLWEDIVRPARQSGYDEIWLVGTSLGGLGVVAFCNEHADAITGIVLLAPYLGSGDIIADIEASGGLAEWAPSGETGGFDELWAWLKGYPEGKERPELILAFGAQDRLKSAQELLAAALPAQSVLRSDGGHGWREWRPLWNEILELRFGKEPSRASGAD